MDMEPNNIDNEPRVATNAKTNSTTHEMDREDIDTWNPMADDYANKAFNDYSEPTTAELRKWMPRQGETAPTEDLMACYRSTSGDVRLFINGIPPDLTQEGIRGLFSQAGKVVYCKVIPLRDPNKKDTFGFVGYKTYREAERAIRNFDGFAVGNDMRLRVSLSKNKAKFQDTPSFEKSMTATMPSDVMNGEVDGLDWDSLETPLNVTTGDATVTTGDATVTTADNNVAMGDATVAMGGATVAMGGATVAMGDSTTVQQDNQPTVQDQAISADMKITEKHTDHMISASACSLDSEISPTQSNTQCAQASSSGVAQVNGIDTKTTLGQNSPIKPKIAGEPCTVCGKDGFTRCSSCKVPYCSRECQRTDWPEHKNICNWKPITKPDNDKRPYVIDDDDLEISDLGGLAEAFGLSVKREVLTATQLTLQNGMLQDSDRYLENGTNFSQDSHYGFIRPLNTAQSATITEITSEDFQSIPSEDIQPQNPELNAPLITEISSEEVQPLNPEPKAPLITEISSEEVQPLNPEPKAPLITEISSEEVQPLNPEPKAPLITEISSEDVQSQNPEPKAPLITEISSEDVQSQNPEPNAPLITEISSEDVQSLVPVAPLITEVSSEKSTQSKQKEISMISDISGNPDGQEFTDSIAAVQNAARSMDQDRSPHALSSEVNEDQQTINPSDSSSAYSGQHTQQNPVQDDSQTSKRESDQVDTYARCRITDVPCENMHVNSWYDIVVTSAASPTMFWAQLYQNDTLERQNYLFETLGTFYSNAPYKTYVPTAGDVCVAQYTKDNNWYRCKVNYINNNGLLTVTHIDFGSTEDVDPSRIRRITSGLASIPRQAMKCSLHLPAAQSREWSPALVEAFGAKVLDVKCRAEVKQVKNSVFYLDIYDSNGILINDMFTESKSLELTNSTSQGKPVEAEGGPTVQEAHHQSVTTSEVHSPPATFETVQNPSQTEMGASSYQEEEDTPVIPNVSSGSSSEQTQVQPPSPRSTTSSPHLVSTDTSSGRLSSSSSEADLNSKSPLPSSPQPGRFVQHRTKFEAVVSSVMSPREFHMVLTDPALLEKLEDLSSKLNAYCTITPYEPSAKYSYDDICAVRSSTDKEWYRARIVYSGHQDNYSVQLMDLDTIETVSSQNMRHITDWFKSLPPRSMLCCLGGITKRAGMSIFGKNAIDKFTSLALHKKFTCLEISRYKNSCMVELLDESGNPSVARELIDAGLADAFCRKGPRSPVGTESYSDPAVMNSSILLPCKVAITSAKLPPPGQVFQVTATQYESPGTFFIHLRDKESQQKLDGISHDMNKYYEALSAPNDWKARERQLCAALFKSSWLRAYVQNINDDNAVTIFCVDFGNVEIVSSSALRPLTPTFSALPYCALHCSLAYISPMEGKEWSKEAIDFVRMKMPLSSTLDVSLVYKGLTILFIEVFLPSKESLTRLLTSKRLANNKREPRHLGSPPKEPKDRSDQKNFKEGRGSFTRKSRNQDITNQEQQTQLSPRESAILSAKLPPIKESFKVFVTNITSPGCFAIQVADYEMASKVAALQKDMKNHYSTTTYPPFQAVANQLCAAQFMMDDSWYRGWIERITDGTVYVYYPDYGNLEALDVSRLRPLETQFTTLPFAALRCSLGSVMAQGQWSEDAIALFSDRLRLYEAIDAKLVYRKKDCIYLNILDPHDPSSTISKTLVTRNLAVWMSDFKKPSRVNAADRPRREPVDYQPSSMPTDIREKQSTDDENQIQVNEIPVKKYFLDSLPLVAVTQGVFHNAMVCDVKKKGMVSLQILTKELEDLVSLGSNICSHCNDVDHTPYSPAAGELCLACFTEDKEWYRGVVDEVLVDDQVKVTFVDYGNEDIVSCQDVRHMDERFLRLPRQAYTGTLKGLTSSDDTPLPDDIVEAIKHRLLEKRIFARVDDSLNAIEFFGVGPDDKPGNSINEVIIDILHPQVGVPTELDTEFAALVTEVHGTSEIWVQCQHQPDVIKALMDDVKSYCESSDASPVTSSPSPGELLFAKHSFYNAWYRIEVVECKSPQIVQAHFVDYGYKEEVSLDKLRKAKPELMRLPWQAVKCYLVRVVQGNPEADDFIKQILDRAFKVKICEKHGDAVGVELEDHGVPNGPLNMNDYLIGFGYQA